MGGSSAPKPVDYTPVANASAEAARLGNELGHAQLAEATRQYEANQPLISGIVNSQIAAQDAATTQARDHYNNYQATYRPLENQMVAEAQNYDSEANRERLAAQAAGDASLAFERTQGANERAMMGMGVNPNSGRYATANRNATLGLAAGRANAMTQSRVASEATGVARRSSAVGLGRGLANASQGAYQQAIMAGNSAATNQRSSGNGYLSGMNSAYGTMQDGLNTQVLGLGSIMRSQGSIYNNDSGPSTGASVGAGAMSGAMMGASYGAGLTPIGIGVGAVAGGIVGYLGSR